VGIFSKRTKKLPESTGINYKFNEDKILTRLELYINKTYDQHYSSDKIQATEFIIDSGHGDGFCIGNIIKYAKRYGKKAGKNDMDLLKIMHYTIILLGSQDENN
jgi:hypothetical protein|tara:strand:- start:947 stop:1258 length:312 start_codon:yes stop_codon:yes gene_type:complete